MSGGLEAIQRAAAPKSWGGGGGPWTWSRRQAGCLPDGYGLCPVNVTTVSSLGERVNGRPLSLRSWIQREKDLLWQRRQAILGL